MSDEHVYIVPEKHLLRLLTAAGAREANKSSKTYEVGEEHFFKLMGACAKKHKCKNVTDAHCLCGRELKQADVNE